MVELPAWLAPVQAGAAAIPVGKLTRFAPPEDDPDLRRGAVLMLFGEGVDGPDILLTERSHSMRSHPGQISFPGGSIDPEDASVEAAALREAQEETGLDPAGVVPFGRLPDLWLPPSNFAVTTVLAWWQVESPVSVVDPGEVETVLRVPIKHLLDPATRVMVTHPIGYRSPGFLIGPESSLVLWGFTAGVISRLFDYLDWTLPWDETREVPIPAHMLEPGLASKVKPNTDFVGD